MAKVYINQVAVLPHKRYEDKTLEDLGAAVLDKLFRKDLALLQSIDAAYVANVYGGSLLGQRILRRFKLTGIPIFNIENACSSGGSAVHLAYDAIQAEKYERVLVLGIEKLSAFGGGTLPLSDAEHDVQQGYTMPISYAMKAARYLYETDCTLDDLCHVAVKNRMNGSLNENAHFQKPVTLEEVKHSKPIADPLTLFQCCPNTDGAAALIISATRNECSSEIIASSANSGFYETGRIDFTWLETVADVAKKAYEQAGYGPEDMDVAEVHDAFSIAELLYYEVLGWAPRGEGYKLLRDGSTRLDGSLPVNPSGGLMSRGHPIGATGVTQLAELHNQLLGKAGKKQVPKKVNLALSQISGGGITQVEIGSTLVHILKRVSS